MAVPVLETQPFIAGDNLSQEEFLHLYSQMPALKKAELIGGVVFMPSPVSNEHSSADSFLSGLLSFYCVHSSGTDSGSNATLLMVGDAPQPDSHLRILAEHGGKSWEEKSYIGGAPELIAEISVSSKAYDLHQKLALYQAAGVPEYLVYLVNEHEIRWHRLVGNQYQLLPVEPDGIIRSISFPGLWLNVQAFLDGEKKLEYQTLQAGLDSKNHSDFVEYLESAGDK
jgi:Uma2 family endonuclease